MSSYYPYLKDSMRVPSSVETGLTPRRSHYLILIRGHQRSSLALGHSSSHTWALVASGAPVLSWVLLPAGPLPCLALRLPVPSPQDLLEAVQAASMLVHLTPPSTDPGPELCPVLLLASPGHLTPPQLVMSPSVSQLFCSSSKYPSGDLFVSLFNSHVAFYYKGNVY